ncbi:hypothetical protein N7508_006287 [Penicillium antarcticum]|uniref:uncharacterized protein n=1 Tax=Penicillium antarcticum TaxID=416450 RepID=UPI00238DAC3A|nr:uncharacterized protein N7508_006287 [Penicillium antarcticum]KAJ5301424.1 hypothetical protein N7508_006287 [Penicillium antarcticum]
MGQAVAKESPTDFPPPVQTRVWTVSDLKDFMISTFPLELASYIAEAAPIIHRCLLRLGSFPYQNNPHCTLSLDVLRTGMIILLRLEGNKLLDRDNNEASLFYPDRLSAEQRILLFQSLTESQGTSAGSARNLGDDYHLQKALEIITYGNFKRNVQFPTAVSKGPQYPPPEHFPSSNSKLTSGSIPDDDFRPLLRLMLLTQLYVAGLDPDIFMCSLSEIEAATDRLLAAFLHDGESSTAVSFIAFDKIIGNSMQNAFLGLHRVLGPLHSAKPIPSTTLPSSVTEAQNMLKELFAPSVKTQPPPKGRIMNLPLLSQLSMSLPQDFPIEAPEMFHSSQKVDIKGLKTCLSTTGLARILLVSGKTSQGDAILGAYFPKDSSPASMNMSSVIFQLAPVHRTFHQTEKLLPSKGPDAEDSVRLTLALADVSLALSGESSTGTLTAKLNEHTSQELLVDAVEVLSFHGCMVRVDTFE